MKTTCLPAGNHTRTLHKNLLEKQSDIRVWVDEEYWHILPTKEGFNICSRELVEPSFKVIEEIEALLGVALVKLELK